MSKFFVCYYRVSTDGQGLRGLGMDAQRQAVATFLAGRPPLAEFAEVEPFPAGRVIIGRGSVVDAVKIPVLPRSQK